MTNTQNDFLELAKLRLDWASAGIDHLEELVDSFLATKPCEVNDSVTREGENAHISYVLDVYCQPPPTIRFAIGDVIHNLRATLDNLVWGVGQAQVPKADDYLGLAFYGSESMFQEEYLPRINKLPEPIRDWITSIQPYQGPNHVVLLQRLNDIWNKDKHRAPLVVITAGQTGTLDYSGDTTPLRHMTFYTSTGQIGQQDLAIAILPWARRNEFQPEISSLVAFDVDGPIGLNIAGRPESVVPYLHHIQQYILSRVVPLFEPFV